MNSEKVEKVLKKIKKMLLKRHIGLADVFYSAPK